MKKEHFKAVIYGVAKGEALQCCTLYGTTMLKTTRRGRCVVLYVVRDDGADDITQMSYVV